MMKCMLIHLYVVSLEIEVWWGSGFVSFWFGFFHVILFRVAVLECLCDIERLICTIAR